MKTSRRVISEKEKLSRRVMQLAKNCTSLNQLQENLESAELKPYYRNEILTGVWFGSIKFRFTTLGVGTEHLKKMTIEQKRLDTLAHKRDNEPKDIDCEL
jgi:hypothetical protein